MIIADIFYELSSLIYTGFHPGDASTVGASLSFPAEACGMNRFVKSSPHAQYL